MVDGRVDRSPPSTFRRDCYDAANRRTLRVEGCHIDQSDPSRRRLAFSGTLKGSDYLEQEPFKSVSLLLDAFGTQKGGAGDDNKTDNKSLGWLTAAAFVDINGDGLTVIAVQLNDPKPDACGIISRPIETK